MTIVRPTGGIFAALLGIACAARTADSGTDGATSGVEEGGTVVSAEGGTAGEAGSSGGSASSGSGSASGSASGGSEEGGTAGTSGSGGESGSIGTGDTGVLTGESGVGTGEEGTAGTTTASSSGGGASCPRGDYACTDGIDNDMDGKTDLDDLECTGPCDDDEDTFQTGIPGDNMDCKQDCFFDGNSGSGNDGCVWSLRCDPENPGANIGCEYTGQGNCGEDQLEECIDFCSPLVPNGCDCFGCCTIKLEDGTEVNIFLNSGPDCALDNLDACNSCTPSTDCGNTCEPEMCEVCFGEEEPPEGCDDPGCPEDRIPCDAQADCPTSYWCLTGCCVPPPPG